MSYPFSAEALFPMAIDHSFLASAGSAPPLSEIAMPFPTPTVYAASASPTIAPAETATKTTALNVLLDFVLPFARLSSETATHVCVIVFQITLYI